MLQGITFADLAAAVLAVIMAIIIGALSIQAKGIPNEVVAFLTLVTGYLFRGVQTPITNGVKTLAASTDNIP
jgi:hypothetical protein